MQVKFFTTLVIIIQVMFRAVRHGSSSNSIVNECASLCQFRGGEETQGKGGEGGRRERVGGYRVERGRSEMVPHLHKSAPMGKR